MNASCIRFLATGAMIAASCVAWVASAQTLYKLIDKNGKVTYANEAPKDFDGKVIRIDVDPNANTATLPKYHPSAAPAAKPADLRALREKVAERREALQKAKNNPGDEDVQWVGNAGGGTRAVPTEAYRNRLAELERSLKEAEDELHAAEKNHR
jgi:hypothetical protein